MRGLGSCFDGFMPIKHRDLSSWESLCNVKIRENFAWKRRRKRNEAVRFPVQVKEKVAKGNRGAVRGVHVAFSPGQMEQLYNNADACRCLATRRSVRPLASKPEWSATFSAFFFLFFRSTKVQVCLRVQKFGFHCSLWFTSATRLPFYSALLELAVEITFHSFLELGWSKESCSCLRFDRRAVVGSFEDFSLLELVAFSNSAFEKLCSLRGSSGSRVSLSSWLQNLHT